MTSSRTALAALGVDTALVVVFAATGRLSHAENVLVGLWTTAWPFLAALAGVPTGYAVDAMNGRGGLDHRIKPLVAMTGPMWAWFAVAFVVMMAVTAAIIAAQRAWLRSRR